MKTTQDEFYDDWDREWDAMSHTTSDYLTVALCVECHRGTHGFHGTKALMKIAKLSELDLLAETIRLLDEKGGESDLTPLKKVSQTGSKQENAA